MANFRRFDAGKDQDTRDKGGDCQVRALVVTLGLEYDAAWHLLYRMQGERRKCGFCLVDSLNDGDQRLRIKARLSFPAKAGRKRMTGADFCKKHKKGRFILRMAHHVAAVVDGELLDTWDSSQKCVYAAWEMDTQ